MPKELYLYSPIYDFVAEDLISRIEESAGEDIVLRINSPGGSVFSGWGIIAKLKEATGKITAKVDGYAASMSAFMLLFIDQVEALDTSSFILHRADMYVSTPEDQAFLDNINKDLKKKMGAKLNFAKLKELKGVGIEELFDPKQRIDVVLNAKDAKAIGLINKINKIAPAEVQALNDKYYQIAATTAPPIHTPNNNTMTIEKLKAEHPEVYNAIMLAGEKAGAQKELARVTSHLQYLDVDPKKVIEGITKGESLTAEQSTEYTTLRISKNVLDKIEAAKPGSVKTSEVSVEEKTKTEKETNDFMSEAFGHLGVKTEEVKK